MAADASTALAGALSLSGVAARIQTSNNDMDHFCNLIYYLGYTVSDNAFLLHFFSIARRVCFYNLIFIEAECSIITLSPSHSLTPLPNAVRQKVQQFLNAACTGNVDLLKSKLTFYTRVLVPLSCWDSIYLAGILLG